MRLYQSMDFLMMEQADSRKRHCNAVLIAGFNYIVVTDRTAGLCDKLNAALVCALDVIAEREECVRTQ